MRNEIKITTFIIFAIISVGMFWQGLSVVAQASPPPGCPGSEAAGPPAPGIDCDDPSTWNTSGDSTANENVQGTRCDFDGNGEKDDGFVTSNPFGDKYDSSTGEGDYRELPSSGGQQLYCMQKQQNGDLDSNPIFAFVNELIKFLSAGIFIIAVLMVTVAGIQYITSRGNPEATKAARDRIGNVVLGLILYFFFVAIMQFLIPGGIFN